MDVQLDLRPPRYRDWFVRSAVESVIVDEFLNGHGQPRRFLLDALDAVCKPHPAVSDRAPWSARDNTMVFEIVQGKFVVQWNAALGYAAISQVVV